ncbi:MAG: hypothetical protein RIC55_16665 [Pirellulaceae bacterium]
MRDWKRGEIQAIGAVAKLMIVGGGFVVLHGVWLDFKWAEFTKGLPGTLATDPYPRILIAGVVMLMGAALSIWLWGVRKRTGITTRPFDRA